MAVAATAGAGLAGPAGLRFDLRAVRGHVGVRQVRNPQQC